MDPFIPVNVPNYTAKEAYNYLDYLVDRKWIVRPRGKNLFFVLPDLRRPHIQLLPPISYAVISPDK